MSRTKWKLFDREKSHLLSIYNLCEEMIAVGEFLLAHDVAKAGLRYHKNDRKLCQRQPMLCVKQVHLKLPHRMLEDLVASGDRGVETQSLLASAYKDLWEYSTDQDSKKSMLN